VGLKEFQSPTQLQIRPRSNRTIVGLKGVVGISMLAAITAAIAPLWD